MNTATIDAVRAHAAAEYPRECCGLVIVEGGRETYVPCRNAAITASEHFVLPADDYAQVETRGEVLAVVHSHPDYPPAPSEADKVSCEGSGLPWHIVSWPGGEIRTIEPCGYEAPLVGRTFAHGVLDCYTLVRDWYALERHVELSDFARADAWWADGGDLYMQHYAEAGFVPVVGGVADIQTGDVIVMQVRAPVANHAGVYIGDGLMLHHLYNRLSSRDVYGGYWQECTRVLLRHPG
jgi:proteasome lid subunit RPN8/RPN11